MLPLPIMLAAAGAIGYYLYKKQSKLPALQSYKPPAPIGATPVQVVVPVSPVPPVLSQAATPLHPNNTGTGASYAPTTQMTQAQIDAATTKDASGNNVFTLPPMVITPTGATTATIQTTQDVQNALNTLGYGPLVIDGKVGPATQKAIVAFQTKNTYPVTGQVTDLLKQQLGLNIAILAGPAAPSSGSGVPSVQAAVSPIANSGPITIASNKDVQHALNVLGAAPKLSEDGVIGPASVAAIKAFQIGHGLVSDGVAGPKTKAALALAMNPAPPIAGDFGGYVNVGSEEMGWG